MGKCKEILYYTKEYLVPKGIHGYTITKFSEGKNLLEAIDQGKNFELLILDVMMEEADGIALAKGIRERCVKSLASFFIFAFAKRICYDIDKSFCIITIEIGGNQ
ncbi:MAG: hypothetical protein MR407_09325 [Roseburia sp.]|nr:hypothetical protein [Roseburia sp.]